MIARALQAVRALDRHVLWSTGVQLAGRAGTLLLATLTLKVTSSYLDRADAGIYSAITELTLFVAALANFGFFANVVRRTSQRSDEPRVVGHALVLRIASGAGCSLVALAVLGARGSGSLFAGSAALFLTALLFDQVTSVATGLLQAHYRMGRATLALVAGKVLSFALTVLVTTFVPASVGAIPLLFVAAVAGAVVTASLSLAFALQLTAIDLRLDRALTWDILRTSLPFGVITVVNAVTFRFLPDLLAVQVLDDARFATFSFSMRIAQVTSLLSTILMFSVLPELRTALVAGRRADARRLLRGATVALAAAGALLVVGGSLAGPWLLALLTHRKYVDPELWFLLPAMLLLAAVSYLYDLALVGVFALDDERWWVPREILGLAVASAVASVLFLPLSTPASLAVIVGSALAGELTVVVLGLRRLRAHLRAAPAAPARSG